MNRRSSPQDISWFLDLRRNKQLDLDPPYQRRSVWNNKDRRFFLDTVFRGYPCPPIFLHKTMEPDDGKAAYAVVDGKQRLQTLFMFVDGDIAIDEKFGDQRFANKTWAELKGAERDIFWNYVLPVEFLTFDPTDPHEVNQAFDRLNRNMRKLEPQELRHARWEGWFIKLVEDEAEKPIWRKFGVVTNARAKRMKDAQFISELLLVSIELRQIGFDQAALDAAYASYEEPEDADGIQTDEVITRIEEAKEFLSRVQDINGAVKTFATTLTNFYTLWAFVTLNKDDLPTADRFAALYSEFMKAVRDTTESGTGNEHVLQYAKAAKGASTDLAPRSKRLEALRSYVAAAE